MGRGVFQEGDRLEGAHVKPRPRRRNPCFQPYLDFANEYPVTDSLRMMRLLYRLSLGSQEDKHKQIMEFSKTVSSLQNKAREIKYQERLEHIEKQTMTMLVATGGGVLALLFTSMTVLMNI